MITLYNHHSYIFAFHTVEVLSSRQCLQEGNKWSNIATYNQWRSYLGLSQMRHIAWRSPPEVTLCRHPHLPRTSMRHQSSIQPAQSCHMHGFDVEIAAQLIGCIQQEVKHHRHTILNVFSLKQPPTLSGLDLTWSWEMVPPNPGESSSKTTDLIIP
jgi:hypothetical protein